MNESDKLWYALQAMRLQEDCNHDFWDSIVADDIVIMEVCHSCGKKREPSE